MKMAAYANKEQNFIHKAESFTYEKKNLDQFLRSDFFFKARDIEKAKASRAQIGQWIKDLPDTSSDGNASKQDIVLSIAHALQTLHHIEYGGLKYDAAIVSSRVNLLFKSGILEIFLKALKEGGFICLQECTDPQLILDHLPGNHKAIIHNTAKDGYSSDNCVIIYNADIFHTPPDTKVQKFTLGSAASSKPAIVAYFEPKEEGSHIIIGSIHHPGG